MCSKLANLPALTSTGARRPLKTTPESSLVEWMPRGSIQSNRPRPNTPDAHCLGKPSHFDPANQDRWFVRLVGHSGDDLWITGDFINWRLPGLHMTQTEPQTWEAVLDLIPGRHQFACYEFRSGYGFHRVIGAKIDGPLLCGDLNPGN